MTKKSQTENTKTEEGQEIKKKVDEAWKDSLAKNKEDVEEKYDLPKGMELPEVSLMIHVSQLAMQTMVFLGVIPHPNGDKVEVDLIQSKYLIDTIEMLKKKTKESLSEEEENGMATILYDLRLKYLDAEKKPKGSHIETV